ncbi:MAG: DUF2239 family protein [Vicinamibacterales bacterium]
MPSHRTAPPPLPARAIAFEGDRLIAVGGIVDVALATKAALDRGPAGAVLVFDAETSAAVELDLRGTADLVGRRVAARLGSAGAAVDDAPAAPEAPRRPGRPRLGVVAREVTLLPRHWDWLAAQPGGASAAIRRLVESARRAPGGGDRVRRAQEAAYRFMSAMAGDERGYEEALRALYAGDAERFAAETEAWPADIRAHARTLAGRAFAPEGA